MDDKTGRLYFSAALECTIMEFETRTIIGITKWICIGGFIASLCV